MKQQKSHRWVFLATLAANLLLVVVIIVRYEPPSDPRLGAKIKTNFQSAFDNLPYHDCADTNSLNRYIHEVPFIFHDVSVDDFTANALRVSIFEFLSAHMYGGMTNYLKWRAPEKLGWEMRKNAMDSIRRELGGGTKFETLSEALVPYISQRSRWTFYENFFSGVCLATNHLETLRTLATSPYIQSNALFGIHLFTVNESHPLLVAQPSAFNIVALMTNAVCNSLDVPPFLFDTPYTLEKEISDHGVATAAFLYFAARSTHHNNHGFPVIGQLHWVAEKRQWIWDYLTWGAYYNGRPTNKTNYVRSAF